MSKGSPTSQSTSSRGPVLQTHEPRPLHIQTIVTLLLEARFTVQLPSFQVFCLVNSLSCAVSALTPLPWYKSLTLRNLGRLHLRYTMSGFSDSRWSLWMVHVAFRTRKRDASLFGIVSPGPPVPAARDVCSQPGFASLTLKPTELPSLVWNCFDCKFS